jgi:hypothetical protein
VWKDEELNEIQNVVQPIGDSEVNSPSAIDLRVGFFFSFDPY